MRRRSCWPTYPGVQRRPRGGQRDPLADDPAGRTDLAAPPRRLHAGASAAARVAASSRRLGAVVGGRGAHRRRGAARMVGNQAADDRRRARPAGVFEKARPERGARARAGVSGCARRLPRTAGLRADCLRRVLPRPDCCPVPARLHHQRRPLVDCAAGRVPDPTGGVRQGCARGRDGDDPGREA